MKKSIPHGYTYGNFLEDFNIDIDIFEKFNETANIKKKLTTLLSGERTGALEQKKIKIKDGFEAVFYYNITSKGKENVLNMDLLYNNDCIFKDVTVQTFIFITGIMLNMKYNMYYNYNTINEFYKCVRERNDRGKWTSTFDLIITQLKDLVSTLKGNIN